MNDLILGAHVSVKEDLRSAFDTLKVIQVCVTAPNTMKMPDTNHYFFEKYKPWSHKPLIIHGPYTGSFIHDYRDRRSRFMQKYTIKLINIIMDLGFTLRFVVHLGVIPKGRSSKEALQNIKDNLAEIDRRVGQIQGDFSVCLENDSGCLGRSTMNTALGTRYLKKDIEYPWLSYCFDTAHAFGSGFPLDGWINSAFEADVIHFNAIHKQYIFGGCKDEHGKYLLKDSQCKKKLTDILTVARNQSIPLILEKKDWSYILKDIAYIHSTHKANKNKDAPPKKTPKKYNIIYVDPPWKYRYDNPVCWAGSKYTLMNIEDICSLPVSKIAAKDCCLFMWTTSPTILEYAPRVLDAWGFKYKTKAFCWVKQNKTNAYSTFWGMGFWTRSNTEDCILAVKGKPKRINNRVHQVIYGPVEEHSKKPDVVRNKIVELMGDLPRIELFAREKTEGWDAMGSDVDGMDIRESLNKLIDTY